MQKQKRPFPPILLLLLLLVACGGRDEDGTPTAVFTPIPTFTLFP